MVNNDLVVVVRVPDLYSLWQRWQCEVETDMANSCAMTSSSRPACILTELLPPLARTVKKFVQAQAPSTNATFHIIAFPGDLEQIVHYKRVVLSLSTCPTLSRPLGPLGATILVSFWLSTVPGGVKRADRGSKLLL